jgi:hypothetical protein
VIKAADDLTDKTTAANQLWQINFTYLKINGNRSIDTACLKMGF